MSDKVIVTCALNGVLTNPKTHPVPYTPEEMAQSAKEAYDAGAAVVHIHFREQAMGRMPSWDPDLAAECVDAIKEAAPDIIVNSTTGVMGDDISGPQGVLERVKPEMAAMNSGSLNYLKARSNGEWAWPPMLFDNPVSKVERFLEVMRDNDIIPECECFDTGIVRSISMFEKVGILDKPYTVSLVQGVASGMPARTDLLPILVDLLPEGAHWQSIVIGRDEVWDIHRKTAELGGHLRTGVEDTFYLPDGEKVAEHGNGRLIEAIVAMAREVGREPATPDEARQMIKA
ncbi:3-keto-5-aminohexanoate cleavage protein [Persicimonas caeni]|uniref:3-keto-5-aminohexanoate cleavage protein n=1 Tax=Persicimonas caeni TaxID=2292766 RepID=A0A4Y6PUB4_PERCE|nr:3-keto-5-aminohexanoate cleavage protein [Persicimonas caeni]QDG51833.1 3-keto-5-aminohexanoate cleavage protein [Persicimonas caeni]QED33054.1 3-keto-5-aminohexanoate cleavage protein [Persicimonas caeni]